MNGTARPTPTRPYFPDPRLISAITGRPVAEVRIQPKQLAQLQPCDTCRHGCDCDGAKGDPACGHYACWGRAGSEPATRCTGVDYEKARLHVLSAPLAQEQIHAARRRGADVLARVITQLLTAAGLAVTTPEQVA